MNKGVFRISIASLILVVLFSSCIPAVTTETQDSGEMQTQVALGMQATVDFLHPSPTLTLTPTLTPTSTSTPTLEPVMVQVSEDTLCRQGPDKQFLMMGDLAPGIEQEVLARSTDSNY